MVIPEPVIWNNFFTLTLAVNGLEEIKHGDLGWVVILRDNSRDSYGRGGFG